MAPTRDQLMDTETKRIVNSGSIYYTSFGGFSYTKFIIYLRAMVDFSLLMKGMASLIPVVQRMILLLIVVMYPFAIVGMEVFAFRTVRCTDGEKKQWQNCDDYDLPFSFNTFGSSFVVLYRGFFTACASVFEAREGARCDVGASAANV